MKNLLLADCIARKGKLWQYGVKLHDKNSNANIQSLHEMLKNKTYKTSEYVKFKIIEKKERTIYCLPYFPDRIAHHAIMNIIKPIFVSTFTQDTYSCIEGRGIHAADKAIKESLKDIENTKYCLKIDIKKFYPSIDHDILKSLLRKKFKDTCLLELLYEIIDSAPGVPIGNYLSQYLANFYLCYFDHYIKQEKKVKNYFRYADDIMIMARTKEELHILLADMRTYLSDKLKLTIKDNYQIFPVDARGIDMIGYVYFHGYTRMRKSIKKDFARMLTYRKNKESIASYCGWAKHADSTNLLKKLLYAKV